MKNIIYYRDSISLAYTDGNDRSGSNFDIWYGYSSYSLNELGMIVNAHIIKQEIKEDLRAFDHVCLTLDTISNIVVVMSEIGKKIFKLAIQNGHILLNQIIIENCYGDLIIIEKSKILITQRCLWDKENGRFIFNSDNEKCISAFQRNMSNVYVTYNYSSLPLILPIIQERELCNHNLSNNDLLISDIDIPSQIVTSRYLSEPQFIYYTITCIEHFWHQLSLLDSSEKCSHLHGHSYICKVTVKSSISSENVLAYLTDLDHAIRKSFKDAFIMQKCKNTTLEKLIDFLADDLCNTYKLIRIELKETNNIKAVRIFNEIPFEA